MLSEKRSTLVLLLLLVCFHVAVAQFKRITSSVGQQYPMPAFDMNRAKDSVYTRVLVAKAHGLLAIEKQKPPSLRRDSTILRLYNYLGALYRETKNHKDSCLYYGTKMVAYAQACRNVEFEVKGLFQEAHYYRNVKVNTEASLRLYLKAYKVVENADHDPQVFWRICYNLGDVYTNIREYDNGLKYYQQADNLMKAGTGLSAASTWAYQISVWQGIAIINIKKGKYDVAEKYYRLCLDNLKNVSIKATYASVYDDYSDFLQIQNHTDEAIEYRKKAETIWLELDKFENLCSTQSLLADYYLSQNNFELAQQYAEKALSLPRKPRIGVQNSYRVLYLTESKKGNWRSSLANFEKYVIARDSATAIYNSEELYKIQSRFDLERIELKNKQIQDLQAKELLNIQQKNKFDKLKSMAEKQRFLDQVTSEKLRSQIETQALKEQASKQKLLSTEEKSRQENIIKTLKIKELEQNKDIQVRSRNILVLGLTMATVLGFVLFWYNRKLRMNYRELKSKNKIIEDVTHRIQATEISALRAQMNPHFIFNCLNSIQLFTAQNEAEKASEYLSKFSRLIRLVLENSRSEKVTLENELETLRLYIEMEAMRFRGKVSYHINIAEGIDTSYIQIPPLLVQPFVENAIWHGLMHKEEGGMVNVEVTQPNENLLHIEILDDGIGREKAAEFKSKSATINKSFGMKVTNERIELINQLYNSTTKVQVFDLQNQQGQATGTKVVVEIPI